MRCFVKCLGFALVALLLAAPAWARPAPEGSFLHLRSGSLDPLSEPLPPVVCDQAEPACVSMAKAPAAQGAGLWIVQFTGPVQPQWRQAIESSDLPVISYLPDYAYLVWGSTGQLESLAQVAPVRWAGAYPPGEALSPALVDAKEAQQPLDLAVQLANHPGVEGTQSAILAQGELLGAPYDLLAYRNLAVRLPAERLEWLAGLPEVVNVEPLLQPRRMDEIQGQILAGALNVSGTQPTGPGYLDWLLGRGFSQQPQDYPIVDVTDDGIDNGSSTPLHPDFFVLGDPANPDRLAYNANWTHDPAADGLAGHGTLNAAIVAGYNALSGPAYEDASGFNFGLGINPFGRVAGSKVFNNLGNWDLPGNNYAVLLAQSYSLGARLSSNSWGSTSFNGAYTLDDQAYDALVRDADAAQPGYQPMTILFAAGNGGPGANTSSSPGNAKNVIAVGAAESFRPDWTDGCGVNPAGADNAQDIATFSSRGPTDDGRFRPDLVAPGTHILGAATQAGGYTGSGVCDAYQPPGQTLYAASSGTSHSTPAAAGAAALLYRYYSLHSGGLPPSPAMVKAYLANSAGYLAGAGAGGDLPSNSQGFGEIDLGRAFDGVERWLVDQSEVFSATGQVYEVSGVILDPARPLRISLAWTDSPGPAIGAAYVNNLDLEVEAGGQTYLGNVFSGAVSIPGGTADPRNNLEAVFLPPGLSGPVVVRVRATHLPGDGLPGNGELTDQDFALVAYNLRGPLGWLRGQVQTGGAALPGATLRLKGAKRDYQVISGASGEYSLALPAGEYGLQAWKYGYSLYQSSGLAVTAGLTTTYDLSLTQSESYPLQGCVTDQTTGQGLAAQVTVLGPFGEELTRTAVTQAQPCFAMELPGGPYVLQASARLHLTGETAIELAAPMQQDLPLAALTTDGILYGQAFDLESTLPVSAAILTAEPGGYRAFSASDGSYEIQLPAGVYTLGVAAPFHDLLSLPGVSVPQSNLAQQDFQLAGPRLELAPAEGLQAWLPPEAVGGVPLTVKNLGAGGLSYAIYPSSGQPPTGGPDPAGYTYLDSRTHPESHYQWLDPTGGTLLALGDDGEASLTLPFPFTFYGKTSTLLRVGNNGAVLFGVSSGEVPHANTGLGAATMDYLLAPFWDDIDSDSGVVLATTSGIAPQRRFIIAWLGRPHYSNIGSASFQIVLYEGSNAIKFQYLDAAFGNAAYDWGASATIGLRGAGPQFLQVSYNQAELANGLALCFHPAGSPPCDPLTLPWLSVLPASGWLPPEGVQPLSVYFDAAGLSAGEVLTGVLRLSSTDSARQPGINIPVTLTVGPGRALLPLVHFP